jgi:AcrR family transcriptional regulator
MANAHHMAARRKAILASAGELFDSQGYAATRMAEVAAGAGVSKGSIYNYFPSKHDLFKQLFTEAITPDEVSVERLTGQPTSAVAKVEALLDYWFSRVEHYKRVGRLTLEFWATAAREQRSGDLGEILPAVYDRGLDRLAVVIAQGIEAGEFPRQVRPRAAATLVYAVMDGLLVHMILNIGADVDEHLVRSVKRGVLAGLGARIGEPASDEPKG